MGWWVGTYVVRIALLGTVNGFKLWIEGFQGFIADGYLSSIFAGDIPGEGCFHGANRAGLVCHS